MIVRTALAISVTFAAAGCSSDTRASRPATAPAPVTVPAPPELRITGVDPPDGRIQSGAVVLVKGQGFTQVTRAVKIYFGQKPGRVLQITGDDAMLVEAPGGTPGEVVDLLVVFEPGGELTIPRAFTFTAAPAP